MTRPHLSKGSAAALVITLAFASFMLSVLMSRTVFERLPHLEDEMAYLWQARAVAGGNFVIPTTQPSAAFWQPFVVDEDGNRFGKYTPGWPIQLAVGIAMGTPYVMNAFFAALTVALVYRLGREIFDSEDVGVIAAVLVTFSPMALLLNATLMGHSAALFWTSLFLYAYWRLNLPGRAHGLRWGLIAGAALGITLVTRPATGVAIAIPCVAWSGVRLLRLVVSDRRAFVTLLRPQVALGIVAVCIALLVPLYNAMAVGDPRANLYRLVWDYDRIGFGEGYGRHGHTLEKGVRHLRFDLSLTAADLFGWQVQPLLDASSQIRPDLADHFLAQADYYPATGVSWVLLPLAFVVVFRRRSWLVLAWAIVGLVWVALPFVINNGAGATNPQFAWVTIIGLFAWLCAPLLILREREPVWTWLLAAVALSLIFVQLTYWIGSQRYSTRYFYEGLISAAILSALPIAWAARNLSRPVVYGALALLTAYSFFAYSLPRISVLRGFNFISQELIDEVQARREPGRDVLVLVSGEDVRWRSYGELMALTSPYLDSDIVAARVTRGISRDDVVALFPGRQIIDLNAFQNDAWFPDEPQPDPSGG